MERFLERFIENFRLQLLVIFLLGVGLGIINRLFFNEVTFVIAAVCLWFALIGGFVHFVLRREESWLTLLIPTGWIFIIVATIVWNQQISQYTLLG